MRGPVGHPELGAWVTLPPLCWEGDSKFDFRAGCSSTLCPPVAGVSTGWWDLGRPFLGRGCVCFLGDEASPCVLLPFATFSLACASCHVSRLSQPLQAVWLQQNSGSVLPWIALAKVGAFESSALELHAEDAAAGRVVTPKDCPPAMSTQIPVVAKPAFGLCCLPSPGQFVLHAKLLVEKGVAGGMRACVTGSSGPLSARVQKVCAPSGV